MSKSLAEQISAFEAKRQASVARQNEIMCKANDEGRTLDEAETTEYDALKVELKQVSDHIVRLKEHEAQMIATAQPISLAAGSDPAAGSAARGHSGIVSVGQRLEPGIAYTRYVRAMLLARGNPMHALQIAENNADWKANSPQVANALRMATVTGADTTTSGWASELVYNQNLASEFIEYLRPKTIIGQIPGITKVPFNIRIPGESAVPTGYWVGQGAPIPVSKSTTTSITLGIAKAGGMCVLTKELIMSSQPSAEEMMRNSLSKSVIQFLDQQFIAPDYAAVANVSPASLTNGVTPTAASGTAATNFRTDIQTLFNTWITNNVDPSGAVWVMTATQALALSMMLNALSQPYFPTMTPRGGTLNGYPVIVSQSCAQVGSPVATEGQMIVLINAPDILLADDGQVTVDASDQASIQMLDNPTNNAQAGTPTTMVSMWQTESVALRAIRFINWTKRRSNAVAYIKDAAYVA
jgi:HK97 family phage major capsid protein